MDEPVIARSPGQPLGLGVLLALALRDEHLDDTALEPLVLAPGDLLDELRQAHIALLHHLARHLIGHRGRGSAGALGVLEGVGAREPRLANDVHRLLEVGLGLAWEADDDVGRDGSLGHCRTHAVDDAEVSVLTIRAAHRLKDAVGA